MSFSIRPVDLQNVLSMLSKVGSSANVQVTLVNEQSVLPDGFTFVPRHASNKFARFLQAPQSVLLFDHAAVEAPDNVVLIACPVTISDDKAHGHWSVSYDELAALSSFLSGTLITVSPAVEANLTGDMSAADTLVCTCENRNYTLQCQTFTDEADAPFASRRISLVRLISDLTKKQPLAYVLPCGPSTWFASVLKDEDSMTIGFVEIHQQGQEQHCAVLMTAKRSETVLLEEPRAPLIAVADSPLAQVARAAAEAAEKESRIELSGPDVKRVMHSTEAILGLCGAPGARARCAQAVEVATKNLPLLKARSGNDGYVCILKSNGHGLCLAFGMVGNVAAVSNYMAFVKEE